jgi:hypothetical protein
LIFLLSYLSKDLGRIVYTIKDIGNIEVLDSFVERHQMKQNAKVKVVSYGIEGQRIEGILESNGEEINVYRTVDSEFIEEYKFRNG